MIRASARPWQVSIELMKSAIVVTSHPFASYEIYLVLLGMGVTIILQVVLLNISLETFLAQSVVPVYQAAGIITGVGRRLQFSLCDAPQFAFGLLFAQGDTDGSGDAGQRPVSIALCRALLRPVPAGATIVMQVLRAPRGPPPSFFPHPEL